MSQLIVEVCKVEKIDKHPNADKLSIVTIKGWNCIVGLDQYKAGDLVVYCPPDSVIPNDIIEKYNLEYLKKGSRVRTVKLRGYISQGLILEIPTEVNWKEGQDVAKELNITKYEPPAPAYQQLRGRQPNKRRRNIHFDKYTEIENIKNYNRIFQEGDLVIITEKIHGTNFRAGKLPITTGYSFIDKIKYFINKFILRQAYEFVYGSHNVQLVASNRKKNFYGEDVYGQIAKKYNLAEIIPPNYTLYGEIYGKKIQDLDYGLDGIDVMFFDIKYKDKYLSYSEFYRFCFYYNLPIVPVLYRGIFTEEKVKKCTEGNSFVCTSQIKEGCVVKPVSEEMNNRIGRKILKSINPEYLLRKGGTEYK